MAELLQPFLSAPCHSEPAKAGEEPAVLSPFQLQSISTYIDILLHWNTRINLTAIRNEEEIVTRHFGESLFAARHLLPDTRGTFALGRPPERSSADREEHDFSRANTAPERSRASAPEARTVRVADLGSGAGFPGIPIKLWAPHLALTLIESNHKKATFLREIVRALTLTDINIQNTRAETLPQASFDLVTLRAVERFANTLPVAASLVAPAGRLALLTAASQLNAARSTLPKLSWDTPLLIPQSKSRLLLIGNAESK
ncbi:MAG: 16S rRNA (guanine(527)-N(7))-methyltransferase RsmG [Candidatus Sulfotelmatobacter sp.]